MTTNSNTIRVIDIVDGTIVDGPGLRTSIYMAGCKHQCPGCHNPQSWPMDAGDVMNIEDIVSRVIENDMDVTLSGGDPLYQIEGVLLLCEAIHAVGKNIWLYTGYTFEEVASHPSLSRILDAIDVMVDGRYIAELRDISLRFRGSSNQRIIDVRNSRRGEIVEWKG